MEIRKTAEQVNIRLAAKEEKEILAEIEGICFPPAEAAEKEEVFKRMEVFPENFVVAELDGKVIGFINGCTTDKPVLEDELYHNVSLHKKDGFIQTVFGLNVLPKYRRRGVARKLVNAFLELARERKRDGVILTCKEHMIPFYESCGFSMMGKADSDHGGAVWYDMQQWFAREEKYSREASNENTNV